MSFLPNFCSIEKPNLKGRDFVIGDLHGCTGALYKELNKINFDPSVDRVFSVGDLIDRGPDSFGALCLLKEPWFYPVRGNHDDMLLSALNRFDSAYHTALDFEHNGGDWYFDLSRNKKDEIEYEIAPLLEGLPHVRMVQPSDEMSGFNIAHAELLTPIRDPRARGIELSVLTDDILMDVAKKGAAEVFLIEGALDRLQAICTWSRSLSKEAPKASIDEDSVPLLGRATSEADLFCPSAKPYHPGLSVTFVGHSIMNRLRLHRSHFFCDRGAYAATEFPGMRLSMIDAKNTLLWLERYFPRNNYVQDCKPRTEKP